MATTRTTVDALKRQAADAYREGREMHMNHVEALERARSFVAMPASTIEEWCEVEALKIKRRLDDPLDPVFGVDAPGGSLDRGFE